MGWHSAYRWNESSLLCSLYPAAMWNTHASKEHTADYATGHPLFSHAIQGRWFIRPFSSRSHLMGRRPRQTRGNAFRRHWVLAGCTATPSACKSSSDAAFVTAISTAVFTAHSGWQMKSNQAHGLCWTRSIYVEGDSRLATLLRVELLFGKRALSLCMNRYCSYILSS